jgi:xanthine dehydrogenase accessory factor
MINILQRMIDLLRRGETFAVASVLRAHGSPGRIGHKMIVRRDGSTYGTIGGGSIEERVKRDALEALRRGEGALHAYDLSTHSPDAVDAICGGRQEVAIEIVPGRPNILILGAGHMGRAVSEMCRLLEYGFTVVDERTEMTGGKDWPGAEAVHRADPADFLRKEDLSPYTHLLIMTHSHTKDGAALEAALEQFPGKIGMIGSQRKRTGVIASLPAHLKSKAETVRCPVGISIPARSPAEIAVAILAEIISDRYTLNT